MDFHDVIGLIRSVRFIGLGTALRSVRYAVRRDRLEAVLRSAHAEPISIGPALETRVTRSGAEMKFADAQLTITVLADDLVCLVWEPGLPPPPYAVARTEWGPPSLQVEARSEGILMTTPRMQVEMGQDGAVRFLNASGKLLRMDLAPDRVGEGWSQRSPLAAEECVYGLGERAANFDLRPGRYRLWNMDPAGGYRPGNDPLYLSAPVIAALHDDGGYLVFYNNPHDGHLELNGESEVAFTRGQLVYYFIPGPLPEAVARYLELTGRPPLPPRWALGLQHSRWGFSGTDEVREVVQGYQEHGIPLEAVHLDIDHMDGYRVLTTDPERFGDLASLSNELKSSGIHLVTIIDPAVKRDPEYDLYREGLESGHFVQSPEGHPVDGLVWPGWAAFPDFTRPATRTWWGEAYSFLTEHGIDGAWHDMNEPTSFAAWGDKTLPLTAVHDFDGTAGDHRTAHNLYALEMNRAGYEGLRKLRPDQRPFLLTRSGFPGVQRYAWNWTGDSESTWDGLRQTIPTVLGLSLSGIPYCGPDIGGFTGHPNEELYLRWFQIGAFMPFFRTHSSITASRREPWRFQPQTLHHVRRLVQTRLSLMPYLYTLAALAAEQGRLLVRPLCWFDFKDPDLRRVGDAFGLGNALLVAPVVKEGATDRQVRVPSGVWYDFWSGEALEGGRTLTLPAPIGAVPVLAKGGSMVPKLEGEQLVLEIYLPREGSCRGSVYSDAGDGYGAHRWDHFEARSGEGTWQLGHHVEGDPAALAYSDSVLLRAHTPRGRVAHIELDSQPSPPDRPIPIGHLDQVRIVVRQTD